MTRRTLATAGIAFWLPAGALAGEASWRTIRPAGFVTDVAGVLQTDERSSFEAELAQFRQDTGVELSVIVLDQLDGEPIETAALELGRRWGVGGRQKDTGLLLLIAVAERALRLEVGYGLEGTIPDAVARRILDDEVAPPLRKGAYGAGIQSGMAALKRQIQASGAGAARASPPAARIAARSVLVPFLWLTIVFGGVFGATRSWWLGGLLGAALGTFFALRTGFWILLPLVGAYGLLVDWVFSRWLPTRGGAGRHGWFGGNGRGSSGGHSFGGGSFGGGGASSRW